MDNRFLKDEISRKLNYLLKKNQTTGKELAHELGFSQQSISSYCTARSLPPANFIAAAAKHFRVSADWLLGLSRRENNDRPDTVADVARGLVWFYEYGWGNQSPGQLPPGMFVKEKYLSDFCANWGAIWELKNNGSLSAPAYQRLLQALLDSLRSIEYRAVMDQFGDVDVIPVDLDEEIERQMQMRRIAGTEVPDNGQHDTESD